MTTKEIENYLTKRVYIDHDVVTFRFLSRHFSIHVDRAKNELATYHRNSAFRGQACTATYMLMGEAYPEHKAKQQQALFASQDSEAYDVMMMYGPTPDESEGKEECDGDGYDDGEEVTEFLSMLVNEDDLEAAKSRYDTITTEYVYSVASSRLIDGGLICHPTEEVREIDNKNGQEWADKVGRLTCPGVTLCPIEAPKILPFRRTSTDGPGRTNLAVAGPSKPAATTEKDAKKAEPAKATIGKKFSVDNKPAPATKAQEAVGNRQKKMNFFQPKKTNSAKSTEDSKGKGKVKDEVEQSADEEVDTPKVKPQVKTAPASKSKTEVPTRGTKRKTPATYSDNDSEPPHTTPPRSSPDDTIVRVQKGVILSSDEDDSPKPKATSSRKAKLAARAEEQERQALKAMLELDDDKVIKQSRRKTSSKARYIAPEESDDEPEQSSIAKDSPQEEQEEFEPLGLAHLEDEDVEMDEDIESKPKAKRKPKKVIPVGKNGLKKKRVMKSKTKVDDKGYIVTEDYSSYESVDEEQEPEPAKPKKSKAKATERKNPEEKKKPITISSASTTQKKRRQSGGQTETDDETAAPSPKPALKPKPLAKSGTSKSNGNGGATKGSTSKVVKGQKSINTFFAPSKK